MHTFCAYLTFSDNRSSSIYKTNSINDLVKWLTMSYDVRHDNTDLGVVVSVDESDVYKGELNHVVILGLKQILFDNFG